jgi:hypothetical protein
MKNLMKAFGIALLFSGVFAVTNVSAQTVVGRDAKGNDIYKNAKGKYYYSDNNGKQVNEPANNVDLIIGKDAKGNTVYNGHKGNYYINDKGKQVTVSKSAKITPVGKY